MSDNQNTTSPTKSRGSGGSGGSATRKPAENRQKSSPGAGTPKQTATGSAGSGDDVETTGCGDPGEQATGTDQANPADPGDADQFKSRVQEMLANAVAGIPLHYEMTPIGLFYTPPAKKDGTPVTSVFVAAPFQVIGETQNDINND